MGNHILKLQDLLKSEFKINESSSASATVILQAMFGENTFFVKMANDSLPNDNSLEIERKIYQLIKDEFVNLSPHFLAHIAIGEQSDEYILQMKNSQRKDESELYKKWIKCRLKAIENHIDDRRTWRKIKKSSKMTKTKLAEYFYRNEEWKNMYRTIHYLVTPKMKGLPLDKFMEKNKDSLKSEDLHEIAVQVAQALSVLSFKKVMHNDFHAGNVYIDEKDDQDIIRYRYPKPGYLKSRYFVDIFDFDRSAAPNLYNRGLEYYCAHFGQCNTFQPKFDWYTFLSHMILLGELYSLDISEFRKILGNLYEKTDVVGSKIGVNAFFGLPCKCTVFEGPHCEKCERFEAPDLISPTEYFTTNIYSNVVLQKNRTPENK